MRKDSSSNFKKSLRRDPSEKIDRTLPTMTKANLMRSIINKNSKDESQQEERYYPGLANSSANLCFLNAVIQALASITDFYGYLNYLKNHFIESNDSLSSNRNSIIIFELIKLIDQLNSSRKSQTILRPTELIQSLISSQLDFNRLFNSDQQDAHELLIMLIEAIEQEITQFISSKESLIGLAGLVINSTRSNHSPPNVNHRLKIPRSPFRGLMANRVACAACGFSAGIQHLPTDHLTFILPNRSSCTIEDCLKDFTNLEFLEQYTCRKCTLINAERLLNLEVKETSSKLRRHDLKKRLNQISCAVKEDPNQELALAVENLLQPIWSPLTTKQTMFARPPDVLAFHISRSTLFASGQVLKNPCQLIFPEILILDNFTTNQSLCARAEAPISSSNPAIAPPTKTLLYLYRLLSVIVHQGTHFSGHYLTFRRAPSTGTWWRVSDEDVDQCSVTEVLASNPTLLIYQRLGNEDRDVAT
ncbi:hypothetical protein O181_070639 [Austropuccinia psidii MF-1]|uniref:ubiquitinyl hydrolase 1 n=1 Tax=Austropuccinia psidii MF-1 TaxID=1389203 RepID=A0A9Q3F180_9BASI|nr:hypothetical protein [Austropuccinia psidii MF-1]